MIVENREQLREAMNNNCIEITIIGPLARQVYQLKALRAMSRAGICAILGLGALTPFTGGLSGMLSVAALPVAGISTETIFLCVALGSVVVAIIKDYDMKFDYRKNQLTLSKSGRRR